MGQFLCKRPTGFKEKLFTVDMIPRRPTPRDRRSHACSIWFAAWIGFGFWGVTTRAIEPVSARAAYRIFVREAAVPDGHGHRKAPRGNRASKPFWTAVASRTRHRFDNPLGSPKAVSPPALRDLPPQSKSFSSFPRCFGVYRGSKASPRGARPPRASLDAPRGQLLTRETATDRRRISMRPDFPRGRGK